MFRKQRIFCVIPALISLLLTGCAHIPENPDKEVSFSMEPATDGMLVDASEAALADADNIESAFLLIPRNDEALRWRLALIDSAERSIDLQVFIWTDDTSGRLILSRLAAARERGVRIRLLLDDMPKDWSDSATALVARSPNMQVRRFNPGRVRKGFIGRIFQMSTQFQTLNRRMHNKQLIVDGRWGIIGGRNIGNPYFGLSEKYNNRDLDLLVTGPVIKEMARQFDVYWNADAAYPGEAMYKEMTEKESSRVRQRFWDDVMEDRELLKQTTIPVEPIDWSTSFAMLSTGMVYGAAQCLQDSPEVQGDRGVRLIEQVDEEAPKADEVSRLITPYLIPSREQMASIENAVQNEGRAVKFLVPSLDSNNHTMVHSHYKKYRKKLLKAGAELYEFRGEPSAELRAMSDTYPVKSKFISLHTKAFLLDEEWVLLGSLNVDPRSIKINTEHLMIIESPELAQQLGADFDTMTDPSNAWQVTLNDKGKLRWISSEGRRTSQPARGFWQRCTDFFYRLLPIEGQL